MTNSLTGGGASRRWLSQKTEPLAAYAYQYKNAPRLVDRHEAIVAAQPKPTEAAARGVLLAGLNDKFYGLRMLAIQSLNLENAALRKAATPVLRKLAASDKETVVRAEALLALGKIKEKRDEKLFAQQLKSESYAVKGAALRALAEVSPAKALAQAKEDKGSGLTPAIRRYMPPTAARRSPTSATDSMRAVPAPKPCCWKVCSP
jgi:aminopeptidase N